MSKGGCSAQGCDTPAETRGMCKHHYMKAWRAGTLEPLPKLTPEERFWAKVDKTPTCWNWTGAKNPAGYGWSNVTGRPTSAHRDAYRMAYGDVPEHLDIDHTCHNRACVKPSHLRAVTHKQNAENRGHIDGRNKSGARGVIWNKQSRKWQGVVGHNGRGYSAGLFDTVAEADKAVRALRNKLFTHNDLDRRAPV